MAQVQVRTPIYPTEVEERVLEATRAFFPDLDSQIEDGQVVGIGESLDAFRARVWELQIIDTIRSALLAGIDGSTVRFRLSKQAALFQKISLPADRHALGDLDIRITLSNDDPWPDVEAMCWWLCPETAEGKIVGQVD